MSGLLAIGVHVVLHLNMDCLMKSFRHSDSNCSSRMFAIQDYLEHSQVLCSLAYSAIAALYSSSSCSMPSSFEDSMRQICSKPLGNEERKFSYLGSQRSAATVRLHNY